MIQGMSLGNGVNLNICSVPTCRVCVILCIQPHTQAPGLYICCSYALLLLLTSHKQWLYLWLCRDYSYSKYSS